MKNRIGSTVHPVIRDREHSCQRDRRQHVLLNDTIHRQCHSRRRERATETILKRDRRIVFINRVDPGCDLCGRRRLPSHVVDNDQVFTKWPHGRSFEEGRLRAVEIGEDVILTVDKFDDFRVGGPIGCPIVQGPGRTEEQRKRASGHAQVVNADADVGQLQDKLGPTGRISPLEPHDVGSRIDIPGRTIDRCHEIHRRTVIIDAVDGPAVKDRVLPKTAAADRRIGLTKLAVQIPLRHDQR